MTGARTAIEKGDLNAALREFAEDLGLRAPGRIDFNVEFDPRQDLLYEGLDQSPALRRRALAMLARRRAGAEPRLLEGAVHFAFRDFSKAVAALERAARVEPDWLEVRLWLLRARGYQAMYVKDVGLLHEAVAFSKEIELAAPACFLLYAWRSELYTGFDLHAEALADLESALKIKPDYAWAYAEQADIYTQQHRLEPALEACGKLIALFPKEGWAYAIRGRSWGKCGRGRESLDDLDLAITLGPRLGSMHAWRGEARRRLGDIRGALKDFAAAERLEPGYPLTYLWRGASWLKAGNLRRAVRDLSASIRLDPRNLLAFAWRGEALIKLGRLKEGISDLDEFFPSNARETWQGGEAALRADLDDLVRRHSRRGLAKALRGRFLLEDSRTDPARALEDLDCAVRALPNDGWCRAWRAQALERLGRADEASADFDAAVRLRPRWAWSWAWRGKHRLAQGDARGALRDLERGLALAPALGQAFDWRAQALRKLGKSADARRDLASAHALGHRERSSAPVGGAA